MGVNTVLMLMIGTCLLAMGVMIFRKPLKSIVKIVVRAAFGVVIVIVFNGVLSLFDITPFIGINAVSVLTMGVLGLPGFILLVLASFILR